MLGGQALKKNLSVAQVAFVDSKCYHHRLCCWYDKPNKKKFGVLPMLRLHDLIEVLPSETGAGRTSTKNKKVLSISRAHVAFA
jgi:hypothetical protein